MWNTKMAYLKDNFKRNEQNPKQILRHINEIIGLTQIRSKKIDELNGPNWVVHDGGDTANVLNDFIFECR